MLRSVLRSSRFPLNAADKEKMSQKNGQADPKEAEPEHGGHFKMSRCLRIFSWELAV